MANLRLDGLDPLDPLGYLAALGTLAAVNEDARRQGTPAPRLSFTMGRAPRPELASRCETLEELVALLDDDLSQIAGRIDGIRREPFVEFSYEDAKGKEVRDLKPPPEHFSHVAETTIAQARVDQRRTVDWFAAVLTDVAVDNSGAGKPFALHFTAGQQRFLSIPLELLDGANKHAGVGSTDFRSAIEGPWPDDRPLKVFSWSPKQDRSYALRAIDPSGDAKLGTPGADWLAFRGLPLLSSAPMADRIATGGISGGWKNGRFTYPVWPTPLDVETVRALLRHPALVGDHPADERTFPRGVERWTCRITRSDQGGYGAFSRPTRVPSADSTDS